MFEIKCAIRKQYEKFLYVKNSPKYRIIYMILTNVTFAKISCKITIKIIENIFKIINKIFVVINVISRCVE